nr:hypothetical protein ICEMyc226_00263 [Mycolicibacterium sp.]
MTARLIDGKSVAERIRESLRQEIDALPSELPPAPHLLAGQVTAKVIEGTSTANATSQAIRQSTTKRVDSAQVSTSASPSLITTRRIYSNGGSC